MRNRNYNETEKTAERRLWVEYFQLNGLHKNKVLTGEQVCDAFKYALEKELGGQFYVSYGDLIEERLELSVKGVIDGKITPTVSFQFTSTPLNNLVEWVRENIGIKGENNE